MYERVFHLSVNEMVVLMITIRMGPLLRNNSEI